MDGRRERKREQCGARHAIHGLHLLLEKFFAEVYNLLPKLIEVALTNPRVLWRQTSRIMA